MEASWQVGDSQCVFELFDTASVNVGAEVIGVGSGNLPQINLWQEDKPMDVVWYWPEIPPSAPAILHQPSDVPANPGQTVVFYASASGNPAPTYQWYKNGQWVANGSTLSVTAGDYTVGDYKYMATNNLGSVYSTNATLSLSGGGGSSVDMAYIPGGSFLMGDTFGEGYPAELPVHSVYVSGFYMGKHEVTKALWDEVYNWATNHNFSFDNSGSGKAANHPVHTVSWYDCAKWCNARSEMEDRTPCYNLGDWSCDFSANGYRLPTEAEWEKAARGGQSGKRFPWGNLITHGYANYYSSSSYSYDTSSTRGYHPSYNTGGYPYTSPVGSFSSNTYGLHDMSGNVWEWCGDRYDSGYYASSPSSNPCGASSGSYRVKRGGRWDYETRICRSALRYWGGPTGASNGLGFRVCLPAN